MKLSLILLSTLLAIFFHSANATEMKIYRWVDEDGKTHFSDAAIPGTEQIEVKANNLLSTDKKESKELNSIASKLAPDDKNNEPAITYKATITLPEDDKPLRSNDGTIDIHVATEPEKENTQKLQLYLDGIKLGEPQISPTMRALNIDRGTHQVQVELLDENGKVLAKTQVVTVHLQRASKK